MLSGSACNSALERLRWCNKSDCWFVILHFFCVQHSIALQYGFLVSLVVYFVVCLFYFTTLEPIGPNANPATSSRLDLAYIVSRKRMPMLTVSLNGIESRWTRPICVNVFLWVE